MTRLLDIVSSGLLTGTLVAVLVRYGPGAPEQPDFSTHGLGEVLFEDYVLQFELVGVLLTVAMVGAVFLAIKGETW